MCRSWDSSAHLDVIPRQTVVHAWLSRICSLDRFPGSDPAYCWAILLASAPMTSSCYRTLVLLGLTAPNSCKVLFPPVYKFYSILQTKSVSGIHVRCIWVQRPNTDKFLTTSKIRCTRFCLRFCVFKAPSPRLTFSSADNWADPCRPTSTVQTEPDRLPEAHVTPISCVSAEQRKSVHPEPKSQIVPLIQY